MNEAEMANIKLMEKSLDSLSDSQFLAWLAMQIGTKRDPMIDYVTKRITLISLALTGDA